MGREDYAKVAFLAVALLPPLLAAAVLWIFPVGELSVDRIAAAARDYTDMWAAGRFVARGQGGILFDLVGFNAALRSMFGAGFPHQIWPYPPPTLLLAVPLSTLPLLPGFLLYSAGTLGLLWVALRSGGLTTTSCWLVLLSPAVADNVLAGQNAGLTTASLLGGLLLVHRRPVLAGAILGLLIIKPQLGLLVPVCLIASRSWRALLGTVISAGALIALSAALFGLDAWIGFLVCTRPMIAAILNAPWQGLPAQSDFASPLMAARSIGASLPVAYFLQAAIGLVSGALAWLAWRTPRVDPILRAVLTGVLALAAAPWIHTYDMIPLSVAIVVLVQVARPRPRMLLAFAWFWPGAVMLLPIPLPLSVASVAGVALVAWYHVRLNGGARHRFPEQSGGQFETLGESSG